MPSARQGARRGLRDHPQLRAHACDQLGHRERLDEVVDRARFQARDAVLDLAARGQHDHRHARRRPSHRGEDLEAAAARQHQVEHDRVEAAARARGARPRRRRGRRPPRSPRASRPRRTKSTIPGSSSITSSARRRPGRRHRATAAAGGPAVAAGSALALGDTGTSIGPSHGGQRASPSPLSMSSLIFSHELSHLAVTASLANMTHHESDGSRAPAARARRGADAPALGA